MRIFIFQLQRWHQLVIKDFCSRYVKRIYTFIEYLPHPSRKLPFLAM